MTTAAPRTGGSSPATGQVVLRAEGLARSFGETRALRHCTIELRGGEVHAVVGENGSGKSTLVKILSGVLPPDQGTLEIGGRSLSRISSPGRARALGIAAVFQEVLVVDPQSVLHNVWLGGRRRVLHARPGVRQARAGGAGADGAARRTRWPLDRPVEELELSERQVVVIARALVQEPKVLILDESTSALDVSTRDRLFAEVRRLCAAGTAVVFISHRMDELQEIADRSTVLRNGEVVGGARPHRGHARAPAAAHVGARGGRGPRAARPHRPPTGSCCAWTASCCAAPATRSRSTSTPARSSASPGSRATGRSASCARSAASTGPTAARCCASPTAARRPSARSSEAARHGIAYVPRDRKTEGIFEPLSILDNFSLPTIGKDATAGRHLGAPPPRALPPVRRPAEDPLRLGRQPHHDALGRQPAEGRDRPLAGDGARHRGAQRPHPRRRRGHEDATSTRCSTT